MTKTETIVTCSMCDLETLFYLDNPVPRLNDPAVYEAFYKAFFCLKCKKDIEEKYNLNRSTNLNLNYINKNKGDE